MRRPWRTEQPTAIGELFLCRAAGAVPIDLTRNREEQQLLGAAQWLLRRLFPSLEGHSCFLTGPQSLYPGELRRSPPRERTKKPFTGIGTCDVNRF